jgi:hypothetical protein
MLLAVGVRYATGLVFQGWWPGQDGWRDLGFLVIEVVLFFSARDALRKYYRRVGDLL